MHVEYVTYFHDSDLGEEEVEVKLELELELEEEYLSFYLRKVPRLPW